MTKLITFVVLVIVAAPLVTFTNCSNVNFQVSAEQAAKMGEMLSSTSSVMLNNGDEWANQPTLILSLNSPRALQMKISTLPDCSDGTWEPYVSSKVLNVTTPNQKITAYAQFKDISEITSTCVNDDIGHDNMAPTGAFTSPGSVFTNAASTKVEWTQADTLSGVEKTTCMNNAGVSVPCVTDLSATNTAEGTNTVSVMVTDKAGNSSAPMSYSWFYDKTPPMVSLNSKPASITGSPNASLAFAGTDSGSGVVSYSCVTDASPVSVCVSPVALTGLAQGMHHFEVIAIDKAGNKSVAAVADWKVDLTAPAVTLTQTPAPITNSPSAAFAYTAVDDGVVITNFQCKLDGGTFAVCPGTKSYTALGDGTHTFQVLAIDTAGNASAPTSYTWVIDTVMPVVAITKSPASPSNDQNPTLVWTATDNSGNLKSIECGLDGAFASCPDFNKKLTNVPAGSHTFSVRATDAAGNVGSASRTWVIDLVAPVVAITSGPNDFKSASGSIYAASAAGSIVFTATDVSGIKNSECALDGGSYAVCVSPDSLASLTEGGHVIAIRATDKAGNVSVPVNYSWSVDQSPPLITHLASSTVTTGQTANIKYGAVDTGSGLAWVKCGLITSPSGTDVTALKPCDAVGEVILTNLTKAGSYVYEVQASDNVGNLATDMINITVTAKPVICDPFNQTAEGLCNGGFTGEIYYLTGQVRTDFINAGQAHVDYFYSKGTRADAILNLPNLNVPERNFTQGFPTSGGGGGLKDKDGNLLVEYFAFKLNTVVKLDPTIDLPGYYQIATLSDDGSVVNWAPNATTPLSKLIDNDGAHAVGMGCSTQTIYVKDTTRLPMEVKYYQGPATEIALVMMWRRVEDASSKADDFCGQVDQQGYFGADFSDMSNKHKFGQLLDRGWKVMAPGNFVAPLTNVTN